MVLLRLPAHLVLLLVHAAGALAYAQPTAAAGTSAAGCSAVDPFRALGGERYSCWTCGSSIEAAAARCKDVCRPDEREDETYASLHELGDEGWVGASQSQAEGSSSAAAETAGYQRVGVDEVASAAPPADRPPWPDIGDVAATPSSTLEPTPKVSQSSSQGANSQPTTSSAASIPADEPFLSFEDWKALQLAAGSFDGGSPPRVPSPSSLAIDGLRDALGASSASAGLGPEPDAPSVDRPPPASLAPTVSALTRPGSSSEPPGPPTPSPAPSVRSPSRRFNYASLDCSARVHYSSPQTRSPSALLHKSKDRYMLTPCSAASHYVVIELCDEIRIDTLEVGNFEFFSSVVRDVRVRAGDSEGDGRDADYAGWKELGTFRLANLRGVQPFKFEPPTGFHRYLRLDFVGHYGTEYYCPVSLVRVYGMNQMEAYRFELGREAQQAASLAAAAAVVAASGAKDDEAARVAAALEPAPAPVARDEERRPADLPDQTIDRQAPAGGSATRRSDSSQESPGAVASPTLAVNAPYIGPTAGSESHLAARLSAGIVSTEGRLMPTPQPSAALASSNSSTSASANSSNRSSEKSQATGDGQATTPSVPEADQPPPSLELPSSSVASTSDVRTSSSSSSIASSSPASHSAQHAPPPPPSPPPSRAPAPSVSPQQQQQQQKQQQQQWPPVSLPLNLRPPQAQPSPSDSGESIYSSIVRRLAYLETTSSLATNYVEAQSKMVRDALRKLEADLASWKAGVESAERSRWAGGLEGLRAQQERMLRSTTREWDAQRREMERERRELAHRLALLSAEITLHRWLLGGSFLLLLVLLACFFALRLGSVEMVPVPEAVARASQKIKEKHRRSTGDIQDLVRRRAASPLPRGTPRPTSPTPSFDYAGTPPNLARPRIRHHSNTPTKRSFSLVPVPGGLGGQLVAGRSVEVSGRPRSILGLSGGSHRKAAREAHIHTLAHARLQGGVAGAGSGHAKRRSMSSSLVPGDLTPKRRFGTLASHTNVGLGFDHLDRGSGHSSSEVSAGEEDGGKAAFDGSWTPATTTDDDDESDGEVFAFPTSRNEVQTP